MEVGNGRSVCQEEFRTSSTDEQMANGKYMPIHTDSISENECPMQFVKKEVDHLSSIEVGDVRSVCEEEYPKPSTEEEMAHGKYMEPIHAASSSENICPMRFVKTEEDDSRPMDDNMLHPTIGFNMHSLQIQFIKEEINPVVESQELEDAGNSGKDNLTDKRQPREEFSDVYRLRRSHPHEEPDCYNIGNESDGREKVSKNTKRTRFHNYHRRTSFKLSGIDVNTDTIVSCEADLEPLDTILPSNLLPHIGKKSYCCHICNQKLSTNQRLKRHIRLHVNGMEWEAKKMDTSHGIGNKILLEDVEANPQGKQLQICTEYLLITAANNVNKQKGTGRPMQPQMCKASVEITDSNDSNRHHTSEKLYSCTTCKKRFICEIHLKMHMLNHVDEELYSCNVCKNKFESSQHLRRHVLLLHTSEEPYRCYICNKRLSTSQSLRKHIRHHIDGKPYSQSCNICLKKFSRNSSLKRHMLLH